MGNKRSNEDTIEDPSQERRRTHSPLDDLPPLPLADFSDTPAPTRHDQSFDEVPEQIADSLPARASASEDDTDDFPDVEVVEEEGAAVVAETEFISAPSLDVPFPTDSDDDTPTVYGATLVIPAPPSGQYVFPDDDPPEIIAPDITPVDDIAPTLSLPHPMQSETDREPDPEHDPDWWTMVEAMVELVGEMEEEAEEFDHLQSDQAKTCRLVAGRITGILGRSGVTVIASGGSGVGEEAVGQPFDRSRHQPVGLDGSDEESVVHEVTRPGFVVGSRVLRRARVRLRAMA